MVPKRNDNHLNIYQVQVSKLNKKNTW